MSRRMLTFSDAFGKSLLTAERIDHFFGLDTTVWLQTKDTEAGAAIDADDRAGVLNLTTGAFDNHEVYEYTREFFSFTPGKPFYAVARFQITEAAAGSSNILFGFLDGVAANSLVDNGGGPQADFDGAVFFKADGQTRYRVRTSQDTVATTEETDLVLGAGWHTLAIEVQPINTAEADAIFYCDPLGGNDLNQCRRFGSTARDAAIKHRIAVSTPTEMALVIGLKAGNATGETLKVDLCNYAVQM